jgi:Holliday junction resolvase
VTEAQLERQIIDGLRKHGWYAWPTHGPRNKPAYAGVTDIEAVREPARVLYIECKAGNAQPTVEQQTHLGLLRAAGHDAIVARSWDDVEIYMIRRGAK